MDDTSVANMESDTAHVGRRPPPVTNSFSASSADAQERVPPDAATDVRLFFQKKLQPKITVPIR